MKHPVRSGLRLALLLLLILWLLPVQWVFWPPLELNQTFAKRIAPVRNAFYRAEDPVRRLLGGFSLPDTLSVLRFTLSDSAESQLFDRLDSIRARGINVAGERPWVSAGMRSGTDTPPLAAELTWHGKFQNHWLGRQRSLKVRLAGSAAWWGLRNFTLITPDNRDLLGLPLANHLATVLDIWHPRARLVRVEVNDHDWGLYYAEEPIDHDFLVRRGLPNGVLLSPRAVWADDFPDHRRMASYGQHAGLGRSAHVHGLALEPAFQEVEAATDSLAAMARGRWALVRDLARQAGPLYDRAPDPASASLPDSAAVAQVLDVARWGAADALRHLLADEHNLAGDNLHVVFDPATGRFFPLYRFEGGLMALERTNGLTNAATLGYNGYPLPLWQLVNRQSTLRLAKLQALHRLTATPAVVEAALRATEPTAQLVLRAAGSEFPIRQRRWKADKLRRALRRNQALIQQSLTHDAWLYATMRLAGTRWQVELLPEAEGALTVKVGGQRRTLLTRTGPMTPGGAEGLLRTLDTLSLPAAAGQPVLRVRNALTGQLLPTERVRVSEVNAGQRRTSNRE